MNASLLHVHHSLKNYFRRVLTRAEYLKDSSAKFFEDCFGRSIISMVPGNNKLEKVAFFGCLYSLLCLILWNSYWLYHSPALPLTHETLASTYGARLPRLDHRVSRWMALLFFLSCYLQSLRKNHCLTKKINPMPIYCNEFVNMIGLTTHLLLSIEGGGLPISHSPWQRVIHLARMGEWIAATPLLAAMVLSFDIRLPSDWPRLFLYVITLQLSVLFGLIASIVEDPHTGWIYMAHSILCFLPIYWLVFESKRRFDEFEAVFVTIPPDDREFMPQNLIRVGVAKTLNATTLFCIFLSFVVAIYLLVNLDISSFEIKLLLPIYLFAPGYVSHDLPYRRVSLAVHRRYIHEDRVYLHPQCRTHRTHSCKPSYRIYYYLKYFLNL